MMINDRLDVKMNKLTAHILDDSWLVFPSNENKVNRDCSSDDAKSNRCKSINRKLTFLIFFVVRPLTCFLGSYDHGDHSDEDGAEDVDDREDEVHLDWSLPVGLLPPQPGNAEDGETN